MYYPKDRSTGLEESAFVCLERVKGEGVVLL